MNDGKEQVSIGDDCLFATNIKLRTSDGHSVIDLSSGYAINLPQDITIGNHVWIGEDVKILKGATIPNNCVVGGYSVVTKAFTQKDSNSIIGGYPAKILKRNIDWNRERPDIYNINKSKQTLSTNKNMKLDIDKGIFHKTHWVAVCFLELDFIKSHLQIQLHQVANTLL